MTGDECDCQACEAVCHCGGFAVWVDHYDQGWCARHVEDEHERRAEEAEADAIAAEWDRYWDRRIDEARGK